MHMYFSASPGLGTTDRGQKTGKTFDANMIVVPIAYQGHKLAMHFIQP